MALANVRANILPSGISTWKLRDYTSAGVAKTEFIALPYLRDTKCVVKDVFVENNKKQQMPYAFDIECSAKVMGMTHLTNGIELLDSLGSLWFDHQITFTNGITIDSSLLTIPKFGTKWKLVSDTDMDDDMYVEIACDRRILLSEYDTLRGTPTSSSTDATSVLTALKSATRGDISPAGISKVESGVASGSPTFDQDWGSIRKAKFVCELLCQKDSLLRSIGYGVKIDFEAEALQASGTELGLIDGIAGQENDFKITFVNGRIALFDNQLGVHLEHHSDSDMDDVTFIKLMSSGRVKLSEWDGIWT